MRRRCSWRCFARAGPRQELDQLATFLEVPLCLPGWDLDIHMIGPDVPDSLHGSCQQWEGSCWGVASSSGNGGCHGGACARSRCSMGQARMLYTHVGQLYQPGLGGLPSCRHAVRVDLFLGQMD